MKMPILSLLLVVLGVQLGFSQNNQQELSIYFAPGRAHLNSSSKAALKAFAEEASQIKDYELDLRAFTDDVGSIEYNKRLAEKRAKAVEDYLKQLNLKPTEQIVEGIGEVALLDENDIVRQRKGNRRVDLLIKPFVPQDLDDFFSYLSENDVQEFSANNEEGTRIYGDKGTVVKIPAKAFVNQKGEAVTEVQVNLKEAYSFGDMLKHNLGTTSGDKLLQTGGMIYIDVSDARTGEPLNLKEGTEIEIDMPSEQALPEGMQLFTADRNSAAEEVNWKPIPRPFNSRKVNRIGRPRSIPKYTYIERKPLDRLKIDADITLFDVKKAPKYMRKPTHPKMPKQSSLQSKEVPSLVELQEKYPRRRGEGKKKYAERMEKMLLFKQKVAETTQTKNERKVAEFQRDSMNYLRQLVKYKEDSLKYENYLSQIESIVNYLDQNVDSIEQSVQKLRQQHLALDFKIKLNDFKPALAETQNYYRKMLAEADRLGFEKTMAVLEQYTVLMQDSTDKVLRNERIIAQALKDNYAFWGKMGLSSTNASTRFIDIKDIRLKKEIKYYSEVELDNLAYRLQGIYDKLNEIQSNTAAMNKNVEKFIQFAAKLNNDKIGDFAKAIDQALDSSYNQFMEERMEKGLASDYEKQQYFVNSVRSADLGWINCDRFLRYEGEKMELLVNHEADEATRFFVVFKEMKSVLPLQMGTTGYSSKMYQGVPADANVKVIGMRIKDGLAQTFEFDGKVKEVQKMNIEFKTTKLEEMRTILDKV